MYQKLWLKTWQSVCSIQHWRGAEKIASGSGFVVDGYLITNNHVFYCPPSDKVVIEFVEQDGSTVMFKKELTKQEFGAALKEGSPEENWDFAILQIDELRYFPSLKFCAPEKKISVGTSIGLLGYAFDQKNLSIHSGIISSKFCKGSIKYMQIDASVNQGNSGGPLIDYETGEVIGIITRAAKGLTKMFDELIESFDGNIEALSAVAGGVKFSGIDPMDVLAVSQRQMKIISNEIKRSANVGIGYAFALDGVRNFFNSTPPPLHDASMSRVDAG